MNQRWAEWGYCDLVRRVIGRRIVSECVMQESVRS